MSELHTSLLQTRKNKVFDVICAGEAVWDLSAKSGAFSAQSAPLQFRPGGGAVNAAFALARLGMRVGLAASLGDDTFGRSLLERLQGAGIDVGGVSFAPAQSGIVFLEGAGTTRQLVAYRDEERPVVLPPGWSAQVLLLSGLSPVVAQAGAQCKLARAARRTGSIVVIDVNARRHLWAFRDPRAIRAVLHEADVVRCSAEDLSALNVDLPTVRGAMRSGTVLVSSNALGEAWATGPFGELAQAPRKTGLLRPPGSGDVFTAAMCKELAKAGTAGETRGDLWASALLSGQMAASARASRN